MGQTLQPVYGVIVGHYWSGKHHRVVKGLNLITPYYTDLQGRSLPVNNWGYDTSENKTKNKYFREMLEQVTDRGLEPIFESGNSGYSCVENLKKVKNHRMGFMFAVEYNRRVSTQKGQWVQVQHL